MSAIRPLPLIFALVLLTASPARADEVLLKNGDRLSGTVVSMSGGTLLLETSYAGKIKIDWSEVIGLESETPIRILLSDGTRLEGKILKAEEGTIRLASEAFKTPVIFNLNEVKQINPEEVSPVRVTAEANAGISVEKGNTNAENYHLDGEFTARSEKTRYRAGGEWNHQKSDGVDTVKNWLAFADYRYFLTQSWFLFANTRFENDRFADLELRTTMGGGGGYQFFESPDLNLSLEVGASYVDENFDLAEDDNFAAVQWEFNYEQYFFDRTIELFHRNFGYWSMEDGQDWLVRTRQGIRRSIYKGFTATLQYNYDYDNQPSPDAETKWDWKLLFLLGYQFKG